MKVKILSESDNKLVLRIKDSDFETVNSIRRSCMKNVPTLAIEDVEIYENNSAMFDEVLAHRLGLIPLITDLKSYVKSDECSCGGVGCAKCTVEFTLDVEGPKMVYARDLVSNDPAIKPVYGDMPIIKLLEGQKIKLLAKAKLNTGRYHAKHDPCHAFYQFYPHIKVLKKKRGLDEICPRGVFKKGEVDKDSILKCNLCGVCEEAFPKDIKIESNDKDIIFTLESWGQLPPKTIFNEAIKNLIKEVEGVKKIL